MEEDQEEMTACEHCGEGVHEGETYTVYTDWRGRNSEEWCEDCAGEHSFTCDHCGDRYSNSVDHYHTENGLVCDSCFCDNYITCSECSDVVEEGNARYSEHHDAHYCDSCYDDSGAEAIHSYHNGPSRFPLTTDEEYRKNGTWGNFMIGFELEVLGEASSVVRAVHSVDDCEEVYHIEEDSSVDYEIVSQPMTWGWYKKEGRVSLLDLTDELRSEGLRSWNDGRCGFHVHMSKSSFTRLQKVKLWRLIYDNMDQFCELSGRGTMENEYASFDVGDMRRQVASEGRLQCKESGYRNNQRYRAVNFTSETIELRFMRGTLKHGLSNGAVEMAFALHEFTASHGISQMNWVSWVEFVMSKRKKYKWLDELMKVRGVVYTDNQRELTDRPYHFGIVREQSKRRAEGDPWVSDYKRITKGDKLMVVDLIPDLYRKLYMVPEMEQYLNTEATFISHPKGSKIVELQHEDGNIWYWPIEAVVRKGADDIKQGVTVMSYSRAQYEKRIGFPSALDDEAFSIRGARVTNPRVVGYDEPARIGVETPCHGHRTLPKSLFFTYKEVKHYESN